MILKYDQIAPIFSLINDENERTSLVDLKGKNVVLYFYQKDDTPSCIIEAQDFTNKIEEFEKLDCVVLGISKDSVESHCKFIKKYGITFNLLSDNDDDVCETYGVIKQKSIFGKKYLGIDRSTFLINKVGKIAAIWRSVNVKCHVDEVLNVLQTI